MLLILCILITCIEIIYFYVPDPELDGEADTKTTSTAAYAAVDAKISALLAFVKTLTLMAKRAVNMAITPSWTLSSFKKCSKTMTPTKRIAVITVLIADATQTT